MAVQCDPNLTQLVTEDVNNSRPNQVQPGVVDGFALAQPSIVQSCLDNVNSAFETFCTLPGNEFLDDNTCSINAQTGHPDALFERLVRGEIQHPDDMLAIWESAHFPVPPLDSEPWITVAEDVMHVPVNTSDEFLGFPEATDNIIEDFAVSNDSQNLILMNASQALENQSDGLIRPAANVTGISRDTNTCAISSSGRIRAASFSDKFFLFVNNKWQPPTLPPPTTVLYQTLRMWELAPNLIRIAVLFTTPGVWGLDIYEFKDITTNPISTLTPVVTFLTPGVVRPMFLVVTPDNLFLLGATAAGEINEALNIHQFDAVDITTPPQLSKWTLTNHAIAEFLEQDLNPFRGECVSQGSLVSAADLRLFASLGGRCLIQCTLFGNGVVSDLNVVNHISTHIRARDNISHTKLLTVVNSAIFANTRLVSPLIISNQAAAFPLDDITTPYVFAISPNGLDIWIFRNGQLFRLPNPNATDFGNEWIFSFNMYLAQLVQVSDYGLPTLNQAIYVPGMKWFLGTVTRAQPVPLQTVFPAEAARSRHQAFRYELQTPIRQTTPLVTFTYATCNLQRANEYAIALQSPSIMLFNNSNVVMDSNSGGVLWESETTDQVSRNPTLFQVLDVRNPPFATTSPNGLYLLYVSGVNKRMRLVNNSFNCARFTQWCAQDPERLDRALGMQSDLCWNALKIPIPANINFVDQRCTCIGGPRLFEIIAPHASQVPEGLLAPLEENMACIVNGCSAAVEKDQAKTNSQSFFTSRCSGRIFNICQSALDIGADTKLVNVDFLRLQNCTTNHFTSCSTDQDCGPGMTCFNGECVASCKTTHQCQQFTGSTFNVQCLQGRCQRVVKKSTVLSTQMIVVIVLAVLLFIMLVVFVALMAKKQVRQKTTSSQNKT